ncbi:MAG: PKD domain-containing protein, partial [Bacteroidota bacterium]
MQQQLLNFCRYGFLLLALSFTACEPEDDDFFDFREPTNLVFADALTIDAGESIAYRDESVGATGWDWTFEGGDPATSAEQTPTVTYPGEGSFLVTLITTYNDGSTTRRNLFPTVLPQI